MTRTQNKSQRLASYVTYVSTEPDVAFSEQLKRAASHILAQDAALTAAREALEINRVMAKDDEGNYTREVTPKIITNAIAKIKDIQ